MRADLNMFPPDRVESAVERMFAPDKKVRAEAQQELQMWKQTPGCEETALFLLEKSINIHTRHIAGEALEKCITARWTEMPEAFRASCKAFLIQQVATRGLDGKIKQMLKMLAIIAVYEFPDVWPDFLAWLLNINAESLRVHLALLAEFENQLSECDFVDLQRLRMLRSLFGQAAPQMMSVFSAAMSEIGVTSEALRVLNGVFSWGQSESLVTAEIVSLLCRGAVGNGDARTVAFQVLKTIFIDRLDFGVQFKNVAGVVMQTLAGFGKLTVDAMKFAIQFLSKYQYVFEVVLCYPGNQERREITSVLLGDDLPSVGKALVRGDLANSVKTLYHLVFTGSVPLAAAGEFWGLMKQVVRSMTRGDCLDIYGPLACDIKYGMINNIMAVVQNGDIICQDAVVALSLVMKMDANFVNDEPLSSKLCYVVAYSQPTEYVGKLVGEMLQVKGEARGAVVYALARFPTVQEEFFCMVLEMLESGDQYQAGCAARAIRVRFDLSPETFPMQVVETIGQKAAQFYERLNEDAMVQLFETCSLAGGAKLFVPVVASSIGAKPKSAFRALTAMIYASKDAVFDELWSISLGVLAECSDAAVIEQVMGTVTAAIINSEFAPIEAHADQYVRIICSFHDALNLVFGSMAACRAKHSQMDKYYDAMQSLMAALAEKHMFGPRELFIMLSEFCPQEHDTECIRAMIDSGIRNPATANSACQCVLKIMEKTKSVPEPLLRVAVTASVEELVTCNSFDSFPALARFIRTLMRVDTQKAICGLLLNMFSSACKGVDRSILEELIVGLERAKESSYQFTATLLKFLVRIKALLPSDISKLMSAENTAVLLEILYNDREPNAESTQNTSIFRLPSNY